MVQADYERLDWMAGRVAEAASTLDGGRGTLDVAPLLTGSAFGDTDGAPACLSAYHGVAGSATTAAASLVAVLQWDVQRLGQVIAGYQNSDGETAANVHAAGQPTLDVYTAHVHSGTDAEDDYIRAGQIDRLGDAAAANQGPAVVSLDANVSLDEDERREHDDAAVDALARFHEELGYTDAADTGPTSNDGDGKRIDYVFTSPGLSTDNEQPVGGGPSDHDGQRVDIERPWW